MDYVDRYELYDRYKVWRMFAYRRRAHLNERQAVSRIRDVDLLLGAIACQQRAIHAEESAQILLADTARIRGRIRASQRAALLEG